MTEFAECFGLDLADALACDAEFTPDLIERAAASVLCAEAEMEDSMLTLAERAEGVVGLLHEAPRIASTDAHFDILPDVNGLAPGARRRWASR